MEEKNKLMTAHPQTQKETERREDIKKPSNQTMGVKKRILANKNIFSNNFLRHFIKIAFLPKQ